MLAYKKHAPHLLSGGQKQRVAIAGVLAMQPKTIVLDEPTAMLDPQGRQEVVSIVEKLSREQNITVVLITHHMDEAVCADGSLRWTTAKSLPTARRRRSSCRLSFSSAWD